MTSAPCIIARAFVAIGIGCVPAGRADDSHWINSAGGAWNVGTNWSTDPLFPNNSGEDRFNALIDLPGTAYSISLNTPIALDSLVLNSGAATIGHTSGVFTLVGDATLAAGRYRLNGGTLRGGLWRDPAGNLSISSSTLNRFEGVTIDGDLRLAEPAARVRVLNGITVNGDVILSGTNASIAFDGTQTVDGTEFRFEAPNPPPYIEAASGVLTLGPQVFVTGAGHIRGAGTILNRGTFRTTGGTLWSFVRTLSNSGNLVAENGGTLWIGSFTAQTTTSVNSAGASITVNDSTLRLDGNWSNLGTISATNSAVTLSGSFATGSLSGFSRNGGTVTLGGTLNNTASTLSLDSASGAWRIDRGTILGGTLHVASPDLLTFSADTTNQLRGVQVASALQLGPTQSYLRLADGARVAGGVTLATGSARLALATGQVCDDSAVRVAVPNGSASGGARLEVWGNGTLTLGPNFLLSGDFVDMTSADSIPDSNTLVNQGVIRCDVSGGEFSLFPDSIWNEGLIEATPGTRIDLTCSNRDAGVIRATGAILDITGGSHSGRIEATNSTVIFRGVNFRLLPELEIVRSGGSMYIAGSLYNFGRTITFDSTSGVWTLGERQGSVASINGGIVNVSAPTFLRSTNGAFGNTTVNGSLLVRGDAGAAASLRINGGTTINGDMTVLQGSTLQIAGSPNLPGRTIQLEGGTVSAAQADCTIRADVAVRGFGSLTGSMITSHGLISADRSAQILRLVTTSPSVIAGTAEARNGGRLLVVSGRLSNYQGGTLTGGSWRVYSGSALEFELMPVQISAAEVVLSGSASNFAALNSLQTNRGRLSLENGRGFTTTSHLRNEGELNIEAGSLLDVRGRLTQASASILGFTIAGNPASGAFGQVHVRDDATLDGVLRVSLADGLVPVAGERFELLSSAQLNGAFTNTELLGFPLGYSADVQYNAGIVAVVIRHFNCSADIDLDGLVGLQDLAIVLANFGQDQDVIPSDGDTNTDGKVDLQDLSTILSNLGASC